MPTEPRVYPAALNLRGRAVVVIGGGAVATRKVADLLPTGARVTVVSPTLSPRLARWAQDGRLTHRARSYRRGDLAGARLAIAATSNPDEHTRIARDAATTSTWINVVDQPELCDFLAPAVVRRGPLTIAVSTGGRNPALAGWIKRRLDQIVGHEFGRLTTLMARIREALRAAGVPPSARKRAVERLMATGLLHRVRADDHAGMARVIRRVTGLTTFSLSTRPTRTPHGASIVR